MMYLTFVVLASVYMTYNQSSPPVQTFNFIFLDHFIDGYKAGTKNIMEISELRRQWALCQISIYNSVLITQIIDKFIV